MRLIQAKVQGPSLPAGRATSEPFVSQIGSVISKTWKNQLNPRGIELARMFYLDLEHIDFLEKCLKQK